MHRHCDSQICIAQTKIIPSFSLEIAERKSPAASKVSRVSSRVAIFTSAYVFPSLYDYPLHYLYTLHHEYFTVLTFVVNKTL